MFDRPSLRGVFGGCDAVLHLATHIPPGNKSGSREAWNENDRIRTEGTRNLVEVALEARVSTFLYPSIAFVYADGGANWLDDASPTQPTPPLKSSLYAEAEVQRFTKEGGRGIILRMGSFYGPGASSTEYVVRMAHRGLAMFFGRSKAYYPLIWVEDAALAVIDGLARAPAGIYNVVDDDPLQRWELARILAQAVGRRRLFRPPSIVLRMLRGKDAMFLTRSQRVSNRKFKAATGWSPMLPSAREGFKLLSIPP
jgi:nucleoside-diphosphate-sugar epimerase